MVIFLGLFGLVGALLALMGMAEFGGRPGGTIMQQIAGILMVGSGLTVAATCWGAAALLEALKRVQAAIEAQRNARPETFAAPPGTDASGRYVNPRYAGTRPGGAVEQILGDAEQQGAQHRPGNMGRRHS